MKWTYVDKFEGFTHVQYWRGVKKKINIRISGDDKMGYWFTADNKDDSVVFNSLWQDHLNPITPIIGKRLKITLEEMQSFVENWIELCVANKGGSNVET